jgi:hypothetical protein
VLVNLVFQLLYSKPELYYHQIQLLFACHLANATEVIPLLWPSSIFSAASHCTRTLGFVCIQSGISFSKFLRIILVSGAKMSAEQYSCKGACSITDLLYKINRFASWTKECKIRLLSTLVKLVRVLLYYNKDLLE